MRQFDTGATRDGDKYKHDYEGFESPLVQFAFGNYMDRHRYQADGRVRESDNWQKGMPITQYMKSIKRHEHQLWALHRGYFVYLEKVYEGETKVGEKTHIFLTGLTEIPKNWEEVTITDALCGLRFNVNGYLHEHMKVQLREN